MSRQLDRIQRLIDIRQREADAEVAQLSSSQRDVVLASGELSVAHRALQDALAQRRTLSHGAMKVDDWSTQEDWLDTLAVRQSLAAHRLATAQAHERRARARVLQAHKKKKQAEALLARLLREREMQQLRAERRLEDEGAQRLGYRGVAEDES